METFIAALQAEGCLADMPRYPLLHQQPFFTEGAFLNILRLKDVAPPNYASISLPITEKVNGEMIKLPSFPWASSELLDQYICAFKKVIENANLIARSHAK
jgi:dTDP-4-amino-4,6-dideoxygalactose transaminase